MQKRLRLITLDGLRLVDPTGDDSELGKRKKKLALLAVIALSRRPPARSMLLEMFWGGDPEERARHSLSDALSHIRRSLGKQSLELRDDLIALSPDAPLDIDAKEFEAAVAAGELDLAVSLYRARFLQSFYIEGSRSFEDWAESARDRFAATFAKAAERSARAHLATREFAAAIETTLHWLELDAGAEHAAGIALEAALASGDETQEVRALAAVSAWRASRERDGDDTSPEVSSLLDRLRAASKPVLLPAEAPAAAPVPPAPPIAREPQATPVQRRSRSRWLVAFGSVMVATAAAIVAGVVIRHPPAIASAQAAPSRPAVAIIAITTDTVDTQLSWLAEGIPSMIAARLARASGANIVSRSEVQGAIARAGWQRSSSLHARQLARIVGATLAVDGSIVRRAGQYVLHLTMTSARDSTTYEASLTGGDVVRLADEAAGAVLAHIGVGTSGPSLSDVETSNSEAYRHYILAEQAQDERRFGEADQHFNAAIAADSQFTAAIVAMLHSGDAKTYARIKPLFDRVRGRLTDWDLLSERVYDALHGGEHARAEAYAGELVARFPRDPRALVMQADVYSLHGKFARAESSYVRLLALDSLALTAGNGPCAACTALSGLAGVQLARRDWQGAIQTATRLAALEPSAPGAWLVLAEARDAAGDSRLALTELHRASAILGDTTFDPRSARITLEQGDYDNAERTATRALKSSSREDAYDILVTSLRERGRWRAADSLITIAAAEKFDGLSLVRAHALASMGDTATAANLFRGAIVPVRQVRAVGQLSGDDARAATWHRTLLADGMWKRVDTATMRAWVDTIGTIGARSYYARDWQVVHHVRGLLALRQGKRDEAERELAAALEPVRGFTRTNLELGRLRIEMGHPAAAVEVLRLAMHDPVDAMGRYATRTELRFELARAFQAQGQSDSAQVYAAQVRQAWSNADPEFRKRLGNLPSSSAR